MMRRSILKCSQILLVLYASTALAKHDFNQPLQGQATITNPSLQRSISPLAQKTKKNVYVMDLKLSAEQKRLFTQFPATSNTNDNAVPETELATLPKKVDLGMNGTPVLDQGQHGTCATFAVTAAIDALLGKGDYISQLCSLELGSYLQDNTYMPSGWEGSNGQIVFNQFYAFGAVSKAHEKSGICGGITEYPTLVKETSGSITPEQYKTVSENLDGVYIDTLLTMEERLIQKADREVQARSTLEKVKESLARKDPKSKQRIVFGVMLPMDFCSMGACGSLHAKEDTWVLTTTMKYDLNPLLGGHEMVITGYDDNAMVTDREGRTHKGLLFVRNSWGSEVGNSGEYYMSYEFFKHYLLEAHTVNYYNDGSLGPN